MLGRRDSSHYGSMTLKKIEQSLKMMAREMSTSEKIVLKFFQSNHEGALIDYIQSHARTAQGILVNPGALTHYSYALRDALADSGLPFAEVHLSHIMKREPWRRKSVIANIATVRVMGLKERSYLIGLEKLITRISLRKGRG